MRKNPNGKIAAPCMICGKITEHWKNDFLRATHHFCSNKCRMLWRNRIENPDYMPHVKEIFRQKYLDSGNPNWRGGEGRWNLMKHKREGKIPKLCDFCGKPNKNGHPIEIHHKDKNRWNNKPSNLKYLCDACHKKMDMGLIQPD